MVAFTAIVAGIGLGLSVIGASRQRRAQREAQRAQQRLAAVQAGAARETAEVFNREIEVINRAQGEATQASIRAEEARQRQAQLEATRRRRQVIRQTQVAQGQSLSTAIGQGVSLRGSTIAGARASLTAQAAFENLGVFQSEELGERVFASNRAIFEAQREENLARARIAQAESNQQLRIAEARQGVANVDRTQGLGTLQLGQALVQNSQTIGRIGTTAFGGGGTNTG